MSFAHIPQQGEGECRGLLMYGDVVGVGAGDMAQWAMWALAMSTPLLGPCGHL